MKDIALYETGSGGDFFVENNDLSLSNTLVNNIYISLFGGNIEDSTTGFEIEGQLREDWWANSLIFSEQKQRQFNSETERILRNAVLNSSGRIEVIRAVENDLKHLKSFAKILVDTTVLSSNKIVIFVKITSLDNEEEKTIKIIWDSLKNEAIIEKTI